MKLKYFLPCFLALNWSSYSMPAVASSVLESSNSILVASKNFKCDGRQYCSQMTSREEAEFFINNCPNTKMDGDQDGIPCENDSRF